MRKIILEEWISLDGYASDKEGRLDFFVPMVGKFYSDPARIEFLQTIDTVLLGRETYRQFRQIWPDRPTEKGTLAHTLNRGRKMVFSNTLTEAPWGKWPGAEIAPGDAIENIKRLRSQPGKSMILWGSISLAQLLMKENLVDEYHLHLCPTMTSGGRKLFAGEAHPATLKLMDLKQYGEGMVFLNYRPR